MTVEFDLDGQRFVAINGGPEFTFNEALLPEIRCTSQDEIDEYWSSAPPTAASLGPVRVAQGPLRRLVAGDARCPEDMLFDGDQGKVDRVMPRSWRWASSTSPSSGVTWRAAAG